MGAGVGVVCVGRGGEGKRSCGSLGGLPGVVPDRLPPPPPPPLAAAAGAGGGAAREMVALVLAELNMP